MRLLSRVATATLVLASLTGCGLILGSFTTDGSTGKDGGTTDGGSDGSGDGAADGDADTPKLLTCAIDGKPHVLVNDVNVQDDRVFVHMNKNVGNSDHRVGHVTIAASKRKLVFTDARGDATSQADVQNVLGGAEPYGVGAYDGGFALLGWDGTSLLFQSLPDTTATPTSVVKVALQPAGPATLNNFGAAIAPLDVNNGAFFVAVTFMNAPNQFDVYAGVVNASGNPPPMLVKVDTYPQKLELDSAAVLLDRAGHRAALLLSPNQGIGDMEVLSLDFTNPGPNHERHVLKGTNGAHFVATWSAPSVPLGGTNGAGFLEGDLTNQSVPISVRSGMLVDNKIANFTAADLGAPIKIDAVTDLAVDRAGSEWRFFAAAGPQLLIAGRKTGTGDGVNVMWLDGNGKLRARASGATALVPQDKVRVAAGTFRQPPVAILAQMALAWVNENNDVVMADVTCSLQ